MLKLKNIRIGSIRYIKLFLMKKLQKIYTKENPMSISLPRNLYRIRE